MTAEIDSTGTKGGRKVLGLGRIKHAFRYGRRKDRRRGRVSENGVWLQRQREREGSRMREAAEMRGVAFRVRIFSFYI